MYTISVCGHDSRHPKPCNIHHIPPQRDYLLLLVKTEAWYLCNNEKLTVPPNSVLLFTPDSDTHYGCDSAGYNDDWVHFLPDDEDLAFLRNSRIKPDQILLPHDLHRLSQHLLLMTDIYHNTTVHRDDILSALMRSLLLSLDSELSQEYTIKASAYLSELKELRTNIYNNPSLEWNVADIASKLCISVSYFQHLYSSAFDCSCQQDITRARLNLSKRYLQSTDMSIRDLSEFCGYQSEQNFIRQFKKHVGTSPAKYRRTHINAQPL